MKVLKWYNRDEFSDQDMAQAKAVSNRLQGKKQPIWENPDPPSVFGWEPAPQWAKDAKEADL